MVFLCGLLALVVVWMIVNTVVAVLVAVLLVRRTVVWTPGPRVGALAVDDACDGVVPGLLVMVLFLAFSAYVTSVALTFDKVFTRRRVQALQARVDQMAEPTERTPFVTKPFVDE